MIPKIAVFDLGKVLVDFDWRRGVERLARHTSLSTEALLKLFDYSTTLIDFELGRLSGDKFFHDTAESIGFSGLPDEFRLAFSDIFRDIPPMLELHARLREKGIPTFILSNTNVWHIEFIRQRFPFFSHFDDYIFSYECGIMKPDPAIYQLVEEKTARKGREILFLDDRLENVAAAASRGWQAFQHTDPQTTRAFVASCGLLE